MLNTYVQQVKHDWKDRIEVEIGDIKTASAFLPSSNAFTGTSNTMTGKLSVGTTTATHQLTVDSGASATTTIEFGDQYSATSKACFNTKNSAGAAISFYFDNANAMVIENNRCK